MGTVIRKEVQRVSPKRLNLRSRKQQRKRRWRRLCLSSTTALDVLSRTLSHHLYARSAKLPDLQWKLLLLTLELLMPLFSSQSLVRKSKPTVIKL